MENQDNQFEVSKRIIEDLKKFMNEELTQYTLCMNIASEVEMYANLKVEQFKQKQNEITDTNAQA
jgi:hypothetical protein